MKKIILDENEIQAIGNLATSGANGYAVMKKVFKSQINDLSSVMSIDPKGNVGLQTCARQLAYEMLCEVAETIFPDEAGKIKASKLPAVGDKPISPWR